MPDKRTMMLPIAMGLGAAGYPIMGYLSPLTPWLIFAMLFITYCKLDFKHIRPGRFQIWIIAAQMVLAAVTYGLLNMVNHTVAEGVFICIFIPTATAAPVITAMLGGSISRVATLSLVGNIIMAILGPMVLAAIGEAHVTFFESFCRIIEKVMPLLLMPFVTAVVIRYGFPKIHRFMVERQQVSFYMWAVSLCIIVGNCVNFVIATFDSSKIPVIIMLVTGALAACLLQFKVGWMVGSRFDDRVSGGQGLAQKNTVLAVWVALNYLNPISSIAPAAYIIWQNAINSWQLIKFKNDTDIKN